MDREGLRTRLAEFYEELLELADHAEWNDWHETFQQNIVAITIVGVFVLLVGSCAVSVTVGAVRLTTAGEAEKSVSVEAPRKHSPWALDEPAAQVIVNEQDLAR